jgi:hypothetical protein
MEGESALWYRRFRAWLLHPRRSMLAVYREWWMDREERRVRKGKERREFRSTSAPGSWNRRSREFRWKERAAAYDAHLDRLADDYIARTWRELFQAGPEVAHRLVHQGIDGGFSREQIQAAKLVLDRVVPATKRLEHTGAVQQQHTHATAFGGMSDEHLDQLIRNLQAATGATGGGLDGEVPPADTVPDTVPDAEDT